MRWILLGLIPMAFGCPKVALPDQNTSVCQKEGALCQTCFDGYTTCTFRQIAVQRGSCAECQARELLYEEVCAAGLSLTRGEVDAEAVCETAQSIHE